jgi:hypothetical protein
MRLLSWGLFSNQALATHANFQEQRHTAWQQRNEGKTSYEIATLLVRGRSCQTRQAKARWATMTAQEKAAVEEAAWKKKPAELSAIE